MSTEEKKREANKTATDVLLWAGLGFAFVLVLVTGGAAAAYGYDTAFRHKIFPGVSVAGLRLDGLTRDEARDRLRAHIERAIEPGFRFRYEAEAFDLPTVIVGVEDPDVSQELVRYGVEQAVDHAYALGRTAGMTGNVLTRVSLLVKRANLKIDTEANRPLIERLLQHEISTRLVMAEDARLEIAYATGTNGIDDPVMRIEAQVIPEREGRMGHVGPAIDTMLAQAEQLNFQPITIRAAVIHPRITARDLEPLRDRVPDFLARAGHTLLLDGRRYAVATSTVIGWVTVERSESGTALALDVERVAASLSEFVKDRLVEPRDGTLELDASGKFREFVAPAEGIIVDGERTAKDMTDAWERAAPTSTLHLKRVTPKITGEDAERLGVTDLLGVGRSNFAGSPTNRRRNIALGRSKMNGILIGPGDTFSQLNVLGTIDGAHGWLPELVIKGTETVPEYGGGLCQISSTTFRAALASGLPIVERRNHSFRVRYYEPAGTDATIYDPAPDFKFKNDTPGHLLITTQIQGDELLFFVWGTPDGRVTSSTKPVVYNIVPPPPTKLIPTTSLPVGQKKCTENAVSGATASFDYHVAYPDGTYKKETFTSYYKPWQAVCLIGVSAEEMAGSNTEGVDQTGLNNPEL